MSQIEKQYQLNKFDPIENNNKFWIGIAYSDGNFEVKFGRVREDGAGKMGKTKSYGSASSAVAELERKRTEKLRKGYRDTLVLENSEIIVSSAKPQDLKKIAVEQIGGADDATTLELINYLAEVNIHNITQATSIKYNAASGSFSTPLGILTPDAVSDARTILNKISRLNNLNVSSRDRADFIRDYFQLVPKDFGMKIPPVDSLLVSDKAVQEQTAILDSLESALQVSAPQTQSEKVFSCKLVKLPHWTEEGKATFRKIKNLYESSKNAHHQTNGLKLIRVYEVEIPTMKEAFEKASAKLGNVREDLWHGTKASNLLSILKGGLQIPRSSDPHCTGRMFGDGIYTSIQSTKALNYATNFWNGSGAKNQRTFMFLTTAALGKMSEPKVRSGNFPKAGFDSTWVNPGTCGVMNHECIVYKTEQINLKYLCEFGNV